MARATSHIRLLDARSAGACALRLLIAFTLAFSFTLGAQAAFANAGADVGTPADAPDQQVTVQDDGDGTGAGTGEGGEGGEGGGTTDPSDPSEPSDPSPEPSVYVTDLGLYVKPVSVSDSIDVLSTALSPVNPPAQHQTITARGGELDFDAVAYWNDFSENYDFTYVKWSLDPGNETIATIDPDTGLLLANGTVNGTVVVTVTLNEGYGQDGQRWQAKVAVDIVGQEQGAYVTSIELCDETGTPIGTPEHPSFTFMDESIATAMIELQANVTVHDPVTGADTVYVVVPGAGLAAQTGGALADLTWWVMVPEIGAVSDDGIYRPLAEGQNIVYAAGRGENGAHVEASVPIIFPGDSSDGDYHPQDSLTVEVVWSADESTIVASKTLTVSDMEALGPITQSYTMISGAGKNSSTRGFVTYTGRGPLLVDVLQAAGVNTSQLDDLTAQNPNNPPLLDIYAGAGQSTFFEHSWSSYVGTDRYYFPTAPDYDPYSARQVPPIIAIESGENTSLDPEERAKEVPDKMNEGRRFHILCGANSGIEQTGNLHVKFVNKIRVVLPGYPPTKTGEDPQEDKSKDREDQDETAIGGGRNTAGGGGDEAGSATSSSGGAGNDSANGKKSNAGAWSVLSAVNKNASDVLGLDLENPFGPFTVAISVGMFVAGGAEAFVRWRWQKRKPYGMNTLSAT